MPWEPFDFPAATLNPWAAKVEAAPQPFSVDALTGLDQPPIDLSQQPAKLAPYDVNSLIGAPQPSPEFSPGQVEQIHAQKPALGKTDLGGETPGIGTVLKQSAVRGLKTGLQNTEQGLQPDPFANIKPQEQHFDYTAQLLGQPLSEGWKDPNWWAAHITHGTAESSPTLGMGLVGAGVGTGVAGPPGGFVGGVGGLGLGAMIQSIAPAYEAARAKGLDHEAAVTEAITQSKIAGGWSMLMGAAPGAGLMGRTAEGALRRPISEALAQIFGVQPALMAGQTTHAALARGETPTADQIGTAMAESAGVGAALTGAHAFGRYGYNAATAPRTPRVEVLPPELQSQPPLSFIDLVPDAEGVYGGAAGTQKTLEPTRPLLEDRSTPVQGPDTSAPPSPLTPEPSSKPTPEAPLAPVPGPEPLAAREEFAQRLRELSGEPNTKVQNTTPLATSEYYHGGDFKGGPINDVLYLTKDADFARSYVGMAKERGSVGASLQRLDVPLKKEAPIALVERLAAKQGIETEGITPASWFDKSLHGEKPVKQLVKQLQAAGYDHAQLQDIPYGGIGKASQPVTVAFPKNTLKVMPSQRRDEEVATLESARSLAIDPEGKVLSFQKKTEMPEIKTDSYGLATNIKFAPTSVQTMETVHPQVAQKLPREGLTNTTLIKIDGKPYGYMASYTHKDAAGTPYEVRLGFDLQGNKLKLTQENPAEVFTKPVQPPPTLLQPSQTPSSAPSGSLNVTPFPTDKTPLGAEDPTLFAMAPLNKLMEGLKALAQKGAAVKNQALGNSVELDPMQSDVHDTVRQHIEAGRTVTLPESFTQPIIDKIKPDLSMVLKGVSIGVLTEIHPFNTQNVTAIFKDQNGKTSEEKISLQKLLNARAFFQTNTAKIYFTHLKLAAGFENSLIGELWHENTHALRNLTAIPAADWRALLDHATSLGMLDLDYKSFAKAINNPNWEKFEDDVTIGDIYKKALSEDPSYVEYTVSELQEVMDQEAVAHMLEIYKADGFRGNPLKALEPILEKIASSAYVPGQGAKGAIHYAIDLPTEEKARQPQLHPEQDENGNPVTIAKPSKASHSDTWFDPTEVASFTPSSEASFHLNNVLLAPWADAPTNTKEWYTVEGQNPQIDQDAGPFIPKPGKKTGTGVVIVEPDGRVWVTAPTNEFGGYKNTFPKGTLEPNLPMQANAIKEVFEETGLKVEITGFVGDFDRSTSRARYYVGRRVGGTPSAMGWESQAVRLAPHNMAKELLNNGVDRAILQQAVDLGYVKAPFTPEIRPTETAVPRTTQRDWDEVYKTLPVYKQLLSHVPQGKGKEWLEAIGQPWWLKQLNTTIKDVQSDPLETLVKAYDLYGQRHEVPRDVNDEVEKTIMGLQDVAEGNLPAEPQPQRTIQQVLDALKALLANEIKSKPERVAKSDMDIAIEMAKKGWGGVADWIPLPVIADQLKLLLPVTDDVDGSKANALGLLYILANPYWLKQFDIPLYEIYSDPIMALNVAMESYIRKFPDVAPEIRTAITETFKKLYSQAQGSPPAPAPTGNNVVDKIATFPDAMFQKVMKVASDMKLGIKDVQDIYKDGRPVAATITFSSQLDQSFEASKTFDLKGNILNDEDIAKIHGEHPQEPEDIIWGVKLTAYKGLDQLKDLKSQFPVAFGSNSLWNMVKSGNVNEMQKINQDGRTVGFIAYILGEDPEIYDIGGEYFKFTPNNLATIGVVGEQTAEDVYKYGKDAPSKQVRPAAKQAKTKPPTTERWNRDITFQKIIKPDFDDFIVSKDPALKAMTVLGKEYIQGIASLEKMNFKGNWVGNLIHLKEGKPEFLSEGGMILKFTLPDLVGYASFTPALAKQVLAMAPKAPPKESPSDSKVMKEAEKVLQTWGLSFSTIAKAYWADKFSLSPALEKEDPVKFWIKLLEGYMGSEPNSSFIKPFKEVVEILAGKSILSKVKGAIFGSSSVPPSQTDQMVAEKLKIKHDEKAAKEAQKQHLEQLLPAIKTKVSPLTSKLLDSLKEDKWINAYSSMAVKDWVQRYVDTINKYLDKYESHISPGIVQQLRDAAKAIENQGTFPEAAPEQPKDEQQPVVLPAYKTIADGMKDLSPGAKNTLGNIIKDLTVEQQPLIKNMTAAEIQHHFSPEGGWTKRVADAIYTFINEKFTPHIPQLAAMADGLLRTHPEITGTIHDDPQKRNYTFKGKGSGGSKPKEIWADEQGNEYMFKPVKPGDEFLAYGEAMGGQISRMLNLHAPEIFTIRLNKRFGSMQRYVHAQGTIREMGLEIEDLNATQIGELQREHVVDWLISNHDGHANQFLVMDDGHLIGIDKGQAFKYFGKDKLSINYHPNSVHGEHEPIYNTLWRAYQQGKLDKYRKEIQKDEAAQADGLKKLIDDQHAIVKAADARHSALENELAAAKLNLVENFKNAVSNSDEIKSIWDRINHEFRTMVEASKLGDQHQLGPDEYFIKDAYLSHYGGFGEFKIITKSKEAANVFQKGYSIGSTTQPQLVSIPLNKEAPEKVWKDLLKADIKKLKTPLLDEYKKRENLDQLFTHDAYWQNTYNVVQQLEQMGYDHFNISVPHGERKVTGTVVIPGGGREFVMENKQRRKRIENLAHAFRGISEQFAKELVFHHRKLAGQLIPDGEERKGWLVKTDTIFDSRPDAYIDHPISSLIDSTRSYLNSAATEIADTLPQTYEDFQKGSAKHNLEFSKENLINSIAGKLEAPYFNGVKQIDPTKATPTLVAKAWTELHSAETQLKNLQAQHSNFDEQFRNALFREVTATIQNVQDILSDPLFRGLLTPYAESRFKGDKVRMNAFLDYAVQRKRNLGEKFQNFFINLDNVRERARKAMTSYSYNNRKMDASTRDQATNANKKLKENGLLLSNLTAPEFKAIWDYTGSGSSHINPALYQNKAIENGDINLNWLRSAEYAAIITAGLQKLKPYEDTVVRVEAIGYNPETQLGRIKLGHIFTNLMPWSTTKNIHKSGETILYVIQSKTGRDVSKISQHPNEDEVLFAPHCQFLVTNILVDETGYSKKYEIWLVEMPEIDFSKLE